MPVEYNLILPGQRPHKANLLMYILQFITGHFTFITLHIDYDWTLKFRLRAHGNVFAWLCIVPQSQGNSNLLPNNRKRCENVTVCT